MAVKKSYRHELIYNLLKHCNSETALSISEIHNNIQLALDQQISRKTVERDIIEISESFKILETEEYPARFYVDQSYSRDYQLTFTRDELQAVIIALENMKHTGHIYFSKLCQNAEIVMLNELPEGLSADLVECAKKYRFNVGANGRPPEQGEDEIAKMLSAMDKKRAVFCKNNSPYKDEIYNARKRHFAPLVFSMSSGIPYFIVEDLEDHKLKHIRGNRLSEVEITDTKIDESRVSELNKLGDSFGGYGGISAEIIDYKIVASIVVATYFLEREVHPSQKIREIGGGQFEISFCTANSSEITRLISSFGGEIKSVKPDNVFDQVKYIWESGLKKAG